MQLTLCSSPKHEWDANVRFVELPLVKREPKLAEVVAVVGGEDDVGVVQQSGRVQPLQDAGNQVVDRQKGSPAIPKNVRSKPRS